ncbi:MAG: hypothetical protein QOD42_3295 [Sphingomonadales bacterium]|jgi:hypothetical protein|nr:hypothetical protein [Sphingomonadales bacterium]
MANPTFWERLKAFFFRRAPAEQAALPPAASAAPAVDDTSCDDRLPDSSLAKVEEIRKMLGELDQRARERSLFDEKLELERLRGKHLPALLRSYADIPPEHRAEIFRETGRSASFLLNERLDKIHGRLEEMSRQLARGNLDAFSENIRFVDTKYGASSPFD